jgi:hypothetical protein
MWKLITEEQWEIDVIIVCRIYWHQHFLKKDTKCKLYKTPTKLVVLYGSESWTLIKVNEDKLKIF